MAITAAPTRQTERKGSADGFQVFEPHPSYSDLYAMGKHLRNKCPRRSHAEWKPPHNRPDPVHLVEESDRGRLPELIPLRHGRMLLSPFTFYRGAALNMAVDLASMPRTDLRVQCCGDAHLVNYRCFATPERRVVFDINDLDETLPAPWEWDIKRLAASFVIACRDNGLSEVSAKNSVLTCVRSYREHMAAFSEMGALELWYADLEVEKLLSNVKDEEIRRRARKGLIKAKERSVLEYDFPKLAHVTAESVGIKDSPPTIYHFNKDQFGDAVRDAFAKYRETLLPARRVLLDRYEFKDIAIKVVGVGSVGTLCAVILLMSGHNDPLFLQVKEARPSVLEAYAGKSVYPNHGQRVVNGHQLMQTASDIFLGWSKGKFGRHYYVRQLKDVKIKFAVERFGEAEMLQFAEWCGQAMAHSHARSGDSALISGYLGKSDSFDEALAAFSVAYADQTERDHAVLKKAARSGRLDVLVERE
jgi:uncharacterized protein (DUF2252 family)